MFTMISVASLCAVLLIGGLVRIACRHRSDLWIVSDDAILCVVSPAVILLGTGGAVSLGWRMTHGSLAAISVAARHTSRHAVWLCESGGASSGPRA